MNTVTRKIIKNYWNGKIKGLTPFDFTHTLSCESEKTSLTKEELTYVSKLTSGQEIARFTVFLSLYSILLKRYFPDNSGLIGKSHFLGKGKPVLFFCPNLNEKTLKEYLQVVKGEVQEVYKYSNTANWDALLPNLESYAQFGFVYSEKAVASNIPFELCIRESDDFGVEIMVQYDPGFTEKSVVIHFLKNFKTWLTNLSSLLERDLIDIALVSEEEKEQLLFQFNDYSLEIPDLNLIDLINRQSKKSPINIAVVHGDQTITYEELDLCSSRFASFLKEKFRIGSGNLVGVKLERTEMLPLYILGILKTGAAYVPIDIDYPQDRVTYIEKDSRCKLLVDNEIVAQFEDMDWSHEPEGELDHVASNELAYIIYTSGTTGAPKGVSITHRNAVHLITWAKNEFDLQQIQTVYAATSHCFDLSVFEMFFTLATGKTIRIFKNALEIPKYIQRDEGILINTVPSSMRTLLDECVDLANVTTINLAGEPLPLDLAKQLLQYPLKLRNLYGPSEDTTYSSCYQITHTNFRSVPIGKPLPNTQVYILDEFLQLCPVGVAGKLYIAGDGLANGYLNKPELTAQKFVDNPFAEESTMYDTGDLAKWSDDGILHFLGRKDSQVKLRGYRIELEEIENVIRDYSEAISQAVVAVKNFQSNLVLACYLKENAVVDTSQLRAYLQLHLPDYMIPNFFIKVGSIPMTLNGKIDRKKLPEITAVHSLKSEFLAPRNATERKLKSIWEETLGIENIGIRDHFFELGGHSLMITQIINRIYKELGSEIPVKQFYGSPTIEVLAKNLKEVVYKAIPKSLEKERYPTTPAQKRLWLTHNLEGAGNAHLIAGALRIEGNLDLSTFKMAFHEVVKRHDSLRTTFKVNDHGELTQIVLPFSTFKEMVSIEDFSQLKHPGVAIRRHISTQLENNIELEEAPLVNATIFTEAPDKHIFFLAMHHIISDGWSLEVMKKEVISIYSCLMRGESVPSREPSIQFTDYAVWLQRRAMEEDFKESAAYWMRTFDNLPTPLEIPGYRPRPAIKTYAGDSVKRIISEKTTAQLQDFSQQHQVSLFMTLFAAISALLSRYSNQNDLVIGTPVAGRDHSDLEGQIGLFLNTLPIRTTINAREGFLQLLLHVKEQFTNALANSQFPFDSLVESLKLKRDTSRSPLFDVMVVLQNQKQLTVFEKDSGLEDLQLSTFDIRRTTAQFDISFEFTQTTEGFLVLETTFNTDIYDEPFITGMLKHLEKLLVSYIADPELPVGQVDITDSGERKQLSEFIQGESRRHPVDKTVIDLFSQQVLKNPDSIAVSSNGRQLTYDQLDKESNRLANYIQSVCPLQTEDLVVVMLDRNEWLITSLLAILKLGGAYVPIDPAYPGERREYIRKNAKARLLVDASFIDKYRNETTFDDSAPNASFDSANLAYVIYTSGSTGKPKGVMIEHRSLVNLCFWHQRVYGVDTTSKGTLFSGIAFDASVWEIYPYLLAGATIYPIEDDEIRLNMEALVAFINSNKITHSYLPTRICRDMVEEEISLPNLTILTGGEALRYSKIPATKVYNNYGPTENTVVTTFFECKRVHETIIPIGRPIDNVAAYVLSDFLLPQPLGVVGELCISGPGMARGYLNIPDLSSETFIPNPFSANERLYRTGDLVRWLPDGNLEFIGRKDHQVKVRGNRIELGEIEAVLNEFSDEITHSVVALQNIKNEAALVAYYVAKQPQQSNEIKTFLQSRLPAYMVPNFYQDIDAIPLTANGKVDRNRLPDVSERQYLQGAYVSPANAIEAKVVNIWKELLEEDDISMTDDFFELGGHSLLLTKLINNYHQEFDITLDLKDVYTQTTPQLHAGLIDRAETSKLGPIEAIPINDCYEVSPSQERFWLLYKFRGKSKEFNIFNELNLPAQLDVDIFQNAFNSLVKRHEILRTSFVEVNGVPKQKIDAYKEVIVPVFSSEEAAVARNSIYGHEFDLDEQPLYKVALINETSAPVLLFSMHHIISDGWSMQLLSSELMKTYGNLLSGKNVIQETPPIQYKDYSCWQNSILKEDRLKSQREFWLEHLSGELPYLQLPYDRTPVAKTAKTKSGFYTLYLESAKTDGLRKLFRKSKVSEFSFFVATLHLLLRRLTREEDILIGIPVANRNHYQLKEMVGCFLNTLMLRNRAESHSNFEQFLLQVNKTLMNSLAHQNYPFEKLLEDLEIPKDYDRFPLSPVFLNMSEFEAKTAGDISNFSAQEGIIEATPKFELEIYLKRFNNSYEIKCVFNSELFLSETIQYWMEEWIGIISQACSNSERELKAFSIFDTTIPQVEDPKPTNDYQFFSANEIEQSIVNRFEKQVAKTPDNRAVSSNGNFLTYRQLNNQANAMARQIRENAGTNTQRIALLLDHDETCVVGMLATLKAGFAYVPIDISNPESRIEFIVRDADCELILCSNNTIDKAKKIVSLVPGLKPLLVSSEENTEADNLNLAVDPYNEAYVLYTSGSTGNPKGVVQNHRNVLHYIRIYTNSVHIAEEDNLSLFSTYTFDASVKDIYGALLNGATVCLHNVMQKGISQLASWLSSEEITIIHMVPTLYRFFMNELSEDQVLPTVRLIDMGGEACFKSDIDLFKKHFPKGALLVNDYGPTEATIVSQKFVSHDTILTRPGVPVGRAVTATEVFLWDENQNVKGIYDEGEIVFRSDYLSLGYLNRPELTDLAFLTDPQHPKKRVYKSGDIGRMLPTGEIEFLHRKDTQVKLNGMRIELSEIETQLEKFQEVNKAVVLVQQMGDSSYLVAYILLAREITTSELKIKLQEQLPGYMVPGFYIPVSEFPITRTGKIDKKLLPIPELKDNDNEFVAPETETEKRLTSIFAHVLQQEVSSIGVKDNFFRLGGNSLKMNQVLNKIREEFNTEIKVELFFSEPSIEYLSLHIDNLRSLTAQKVVAEKSKIVI